METALRTTMQNYHSVEDCSLPSLAACLPAPFIPLLPRGGGGEGDGAAGSSFCTGPACGSSPLFPGSALSFQAHWTDGIVSCGLLHAAIAQMSLSLSPGVTGFLSWTKMICKDADCSTCSLCSWSVASFRATTSHAACNLGRGPPAQGTTQLLGYFLQSMLNSMLLWLFC